MPKPTQKETSNGPIESLDRTIRRRGFTASFMSNAKWVRLMDALSSIGDRIEHPCEAKLIWDDSIRSMNIPYTPSFNFDYYATSLEALISGEPRGFKYYKEIEWIRFSADRHDLNLIQTTIEAIGQFEIIRNEGSLALYCYR
jgi:hypothetical protein